MFAYRRALKIPNSGLFNCLHIELNKAYGTKRNEYKPEKVIKDPRQSVQYPYSPGDPHHEDLILKLNSNKQQIRQRKAKGIEQNRYKYNSAAFINIENIKGTNVSQYGHSYEKLKDGDLRLGRAILKAKSSKDSETILLEGYRLIRDAILLGAEIKYLYFSSEDNLKELPPSILQNAQIFKISYKDMKTWSDTTTPSGILGVFKKPEQGEIFSSQGPSLPLTVILDRIKDPGNVGTLIRTAAAIGCQRIFVLKGCVDVWEGKVLRSGMGGHFSVPIYNSLTWPQVYSYMKDNTQVFLADARTENDILMDFDKALSIEQIDDASTESDSSSSDSDTEDSAPSNAKNLTDSDVYNHVPFPVISYSSIILHPSDSGKGESVALVIGNETEGLSSSAKKFAYNCYGTIVTVPMNPAIDSLNTAVAGSIILYEIRRKLLALTNASSVS